MKFLESKLLLGLSCFAFGLAAMFFVERFSNQQKTQAASQPSFNSDSGAGMEQLLDNFYDEGVFGQSNDPFAQMRKMREQMMKQLDQQRMGGGVFDSWYQKKFGGGNVGEIERREDAHFVYYDISVKGLNKEKLNVKVAHGQINISGQIETKSESGSSSTLMSSSFNRSFPVPPGVDADKVQMENAGDKVIVKFPKAA